MRRAVASLVPLLLAAGCGGGTHAAGTTAAQTSSDQNAPAAAAAAIPSSEPTAAKALKLAAQATTALRSYSFAAVETVAAHAPAVTQVAGSVVRGEGLSYLLSANGRHTQVVRTRTGTWVRTVPGRWSKSARTRSVADPQASLLAVLKGLQGVRRVSAGSTSSTYSGLLPALAASGAQVPTDGTPARVKVTLDAVGHVVELAIETSAVTSSGSVPVTLKTSYASFDRVRPISAPA